MIEVVVQFENGRPQEIWYTLPSPNKEWWDANIEALTVVWAKLPIPNTSR